MSLNSNSLLAKRKYQEGFTLLELLVVAGLASLLILGLSYSFRSSVVTQRSAIDENGLTQLENEIAQRVLKEAYQYVQDLSPECTTAPSSGSGLPNYVFGAPLSFNSGVQLVPLTPTLIAANAALASEEHFAAAGQRCLQPTSTASPDFSTKKGLYFCLSLQVNAAAEQDLKDTKYAHSVAYASTFNKGGVFAEFLYDVKLTHDQRVTCQDVTAYRREELVGELFYTFYWAPGDSGKGRIRTGVVTTGGT